MMDPCKREDTDHNRDTASPAGTEQESRYTCCGFKFHCVFKDQKAYLWKEKHMIPVALASAACLSNSSHSSTDSTTSYS